MRARALTRELHRRELHRSENKLARARGDVATADPRHKTADRSLLTEPLW